VSRSGRGFERTAVLLAAVLGAATLLAFGATPRAPAAAPTPTSATKAASEKPFTAICSANVGEDTSRDPAWVSASFENDRCVAPAMPARLDGTSARREEIVAAMAAGKRYAALSGAFQKCIGDFVAARRAQANTQAGKSFVLVENHRVFVSEKNRKRVDNQVAAEIEAFNAYGSECTQ
jgi:hypothetical protein